MKTSTTIVLLVLALCGSLPLLAQSPSAAEVLHSVKALAHKQATAGFPAVGTTYHFKYTVSTEYRDPQPNQANQEQQIDVLVGHNRLQYSNGTLEFHQDLEHSVVIAHASRAIVLSNSTQQQLKQRNSALLSEQQLAVFDHVSNTKLSSYKGPNGNIVYKLLVQLDEEGQQHYQTATMEYHYDARANRLLRSVVHYTQAHELRTQCFDFQLLDYNSNTRFKHKPLQQVLDSKGQLLPTYQQYQLINQINS